jgi:(2Fe-2S) ferredoxin
VAWEEKKLNRPVRTTASGCRGSCGVTAVALGLSPDGNRWFGGLDGTTHNEIDADLGLAGDPATQALFAFLGAASMK